MRDRAPALGPPVDCKHGRALGRWCPDCGATELATRAADRLVGPTIPLGARPPRKVTETTVLRAVLVAVNRLPGVRAVRNNVGKSPCACPACRPKLCKACVVRLTRPITFGLSVGSPDVVGIVTLRLMTGDPIALPFGLEVKRPGGTTQRERRERQEAWAKVATRRGMPCAKVTSAEEATGAVEAMIHRWMLLLSGCLLVRGSE